MPFARAEARYELTAEDKSSAAFKSLKANLLGTDKQAGLLGGTLKSLTGTIGGLIGAGGFVALIKQSLDAGDAIQKLAQRTGASTEFLSRMDHAARLSGTSLDAVAKAVQTAQRAAVEAVDGTKQYADAFEKLGINAQDFKDLDAEAQFLALTDAMSKLDNEADRTAAAMDVMGRSGTQMLQVMANGTKGVTDMWKEADKLGLTLDRVSADQMAAANDAITRITQSVQALTRSLAIQFAPAIEQVANDLQGLVGDLPQQLEAIARFWEQALGYARAAGESVRGAASDLTFGLIPGPPRPGDELNSLLEEVLSRYAREDAIGSRAVGGDISASGLYQLHAGERVISNSQTFGSINIHTQGGWPMSPSETRRWVRDVLIPEIGVAQR